MLMPFSLYTLYCSHYFFYMRFALAISWCSWLAAPEIKTQKSAVSFCFLRVWSFNTMFMTAIRMGRDEGGTRHFTIFCNSTSIPLFVSIFLLFCFRIVAETHSANEQNCKFLFSTKRNRFPKFVCQTAEHPASTRRNMEENCLILFDRKSYIRSAFNLNIAFRCSQWLWGPCENNGNGIECVAFNSIPVKQRDSHRLIYWHNSSKKDDDNDALSRCWSQSIDENDKRFALVMKLRWCCEIVVWVGDTVRFIIHLIQIIVWIWLMGWNGY